jgi:hypothetical protein
MKDIHRWVTTLIILLFISPVFSQEFQAPPEKVDLGFNPSKLRQQLAEIKARRLEKERALSNQYAIAEGTNWQEYDITFYDIWWHPVHETHSIYGKVGIYGRITVNYLDSIIIDMHDSLIIDSISNQSGNLGFLHENNLVTVYLDRSYLLDEMFDFTVIYHGNDIASEGWFAGLQFWLYKGVPVVETYSEPYMARTWWPCNDIPLDKADSADIRIVANNGFMATANGLLESDTDNGNGTHTVYWKERYPITTYLICMAVSQYTHWIDFYHSSPDDSMPIDHYAFPDQYDSVLETYGATAEAIEIYAGLFGEYPFVEEKYGHTMVVDFGMEHQTNTFLNPGLSKSHAIVIHELAHHWWGNWVTCHDWGHIWLNEGFGTYCEALLYEVKYGIEYYRSYMNNMQWSFEVGGSVFVTDTTDAGNIFGGLQYNKGAYVLHMLRHLIGDDAFFASLRLYGETFAYQNAVTEDFRDICEAVSGMDLDTFFQQWIYGINWPDYIYSCITRRAPDLGGWSTYIYLEQTQVTDPMVYVTPVEFDFWYGPGYGVYQIMNTMRQQNFVINTPYNPDSLGFNPHGWLLEVHEEIPYTLHIITDGLNNGIQGTIYGDTIIIIAANESFTAEVISGQLPHGWNLDPTTGVVSGISYDTGQYAFTVQATDAIESGYLDTATYSILVENMGYGPGDANLDGQANVGDAVFLIGYIFSGGAAPEYPNFADVNADCSINVGDAVYIISYVFSGGPEPQQGCVE